MKQRLFVIMAAMLLSISAFAQSQSTLKGDVNGDGIIDVEDITSVVDIILSGKTYGYFYFGTTEPTADNFTSLPGAVASYTSIGEAVGATASVDNGETLYMLCPAAWMKGKHVEVEDGDGNSYDFVEDTDAGTISCYVIYKTQAFNEATDAILKFNNSSAETYYWYVGQTDPSSINSIGNITTDYNSGGGWYELGTTVPETITQLVKGGDSTKYWYVAIPVTTGTTLKPVASDMTTLDTSISAESIKTFENGGNVTYQIYWYGGAKASRNTFRFAKK